MCISFEIHFCSLFLYVMIFTVLYLPLSSLSHLDPQPRAASILEFKDSQAPTITHTPTGHELMCVDWWNDGGLRYATWEAKGRFKFVYGVIFFFFTHLKCN